MLRWQDARTTLLAPLATAARVGVVTDLDGTVSHIVLDPEAARISPRNLELLSALRERLTLVSVISGREADDLATRVGLDGVEYIGNHGLEHWDGAKVEMLPDALPFVAPLKAALATAADYMRPGMFIQDKEITASIHYRKAEDPDAVQRDLKPVMEGLAATHGLEFFEGRRIFELRPPIPVNKGTAFRRLCEQYRLDAAVFLGDDTTDAHGLTAARAMRAEGMCYAVGVGVESTATPAEVVAAADVFTSGVDDVETFLAWLLEVRSASSS